MEILSKKYDITLAGYQIFLYIDKPTREGSQMIYGNNTWTLMEKIKRGQMRHSNASPVAKGTIPIDTDTRSGINIAENVLFNSSGNQDQTTNLITPARPFFMEKSTNIDTSNLSYDDYVRDADTKRRF